jgi:hypothetical protein
VWLLQGACHQDEEGKDWVLAHCLLPLPLLEWSMGTEEKEMNGERLELLPPNIPSLLDQLDYILKKRELDRALELRRRMIEGMCHAVTFNLLGYEMIAVPATEEAKSAAAAWVRKWRQGK